jgi:PAS domain S-box-containing protein
MVSILTVAWVNEIMSDSGKTKAQLLEDLEALRARVAELEQMEAERKQAEKALRDSEALYCSLVENLPQNIYRKDLNGRFTFANKRFCDTLGKPLHEIIGKTDFDFYPPELAGKYRRDDLRVINTGEILDTVEGHQPPGGERIYVQVVKTRIYDSAGNTIGTQGIFWDVTERWRSEEALRESERRFRELFDEAPVAYHEIDTQGRITRINRTELNMLGYDREEMLGRPIWGFVLEKETAREAVQQKLTGALPPGRGFERTYLRKDGTTVTVLIEDRLLRDENGQTIGLRSTMQDVTERKQVEDESVRPEE